MSVTTVSITVTMGEAPSGESSYTITTYDVIDPSSPVEVETDSDITTDSKTVTGLSPGRRYSLELVVMENGGTSDAVSVTDNTSESQECPIKQGNTTISKNYSNHIYFRSQTLISF